MGWLSEPVRRGLDACPRCGVDGDGKVSALCSLTPLAGEPLQEGLLKELNVALTSAFIAANGDLTRCAGQGGDDGLISSCPS